MLLAAPAVRALLIQLACLPVSYAAVWLLLRAGVPLDWPGAALLQGLLAAAVSFRFTLPSWLFLTVFLVMLAVYWSTFRTQVPYFPSGRRAWDAVAALLPARPIKLIDIGSGLGGLVLDLAARRPDSEFEGIELAPLPWLASRLRAGGRPNVRFSRGDYETLDFADFDVVFAYLSPAAMERLWQKAQAEMRPGSLLLSYEFVISTKSPDLTMKGDGAGPLLYGWHF